MTDEGKAAPPAPAEIKQAREEAGLDFDQAAALVHTYSRLWRYWESGAHRMPPASWELFRIKVAARRSADEGTAA